VEERMTYLLSMFSSVDVFVLFSRNLYYTIHPLCTISYINTLVIFTLFLPGELDDTIQRVLEIEKHTRYIFSAGLIRPSRSGSAC